MLGKVANLGLFNLKSHVMTPGKGNAIVYKPPSISLYTVAYLSLISTLKAKVP